MSDENKVADARRSEMISGPIIIPEIPPEQPKVKEDRTNLYVFIGLVVLIAGAAWLWG
jgi:hypothetical protein